MLAYARGHPNDLESAPGLWLMDPVPHIWPYLLGGAVVGVLLTLLISLVVGRLSSRAGPENGEKRSQTLRVQRR
jgi:hypothetical protein